MQSEALADRIRRARRMILFTGAGLSTESGIPDFRSPGGVWSRMRPITFQEFQTSEAARREAWRRVFAGDAGWTGRRPNSGHRILADWLRREVARLLITQNVDNLHQDAGAPADHVLELHGNATYAACLTCGQRFALEGFRRGFLDAGVVPSCEACGGAVKTATISFGQPMPEPVLRRARSEARASDLFVVLGSSLRVEPAAGLPRLAKASGSQLVIVNREATPLDAGADLVVRGELGEILAETERRLQSG